MSQIKRKLLYPIVSRVRSEYRNAYNAKVKVCYGVARDVCRERELTDQDWMADQVEVVIDNWNQLFKHIKE